MDLQEIKKEIESLRKDTTSFSTHPTSKSLSFMGFSYLRVIVTAVTSGLLIYLFKPVYMYNFSVDVKEGEDKLKVKKSFKTKSKKINKIYKIFSINPLLLKSNVFAKV